MRSLTRGNIKAARLAIKRNRGRSFLTMLGIIIGVASVITVASIGEGIKHQVSGQINHYGTNLITVRPGEATTSSGNRLQLLTGLHVAGNLSAKDLATVRQVARGATVVPLAVVSGGIKGELGEYNGGPVIATTENLPQVLNQSVAYGNFFGLEDDQNNYAILGEHAAEKLFTAQVPLGHSFTFRGQEFQVRGIFNNFASSPISTDIDYNNAIYIPYTTGQQLTNNNILPYELLVKAPSARAVDPMVQTIKSALLKNHGDASDFSVLKASDAIATTSDVLNLLTELIIGAAAISLLVGGVGIMNITLVSVTERMREIGIRKAVGATNRQILSEFMAEAIVLSVTGAILGIVVAGVTVVILRLTTSLTPVVQWPVVVVAAGVSMLVGIVFGSAPALKAARKDPITALRNE